MSYAVEEPLNRELNERLRMEVGWEDVGKGLTKVLVGYFVVFVGTAVGIGLVILALHNLGTNPNLQRNRTPPLGSLWQFYIGLGILSVIGLLSFVIILGGQLRCMLGAAERHGARWYMFLAITALIIGPAFHMASAFAGLRSFPDWKRGAMVLDELQLTELGRTMQLVGFGIGLLYPMFFILFLRAIALCMNSRGLAMFVNLYLLLAAGLTAVTGYLILNPAVFVRNPLALLLIGGGWVVSMIVYVVIILLIRVVIYQTMERIRSPLEY
jgi:hypothetical protein